jgi:arabinofuranosyltransferase
MNKAKQIYDQISAKHTTYLPIFLIITCLFLGVNNAFIQDDAFISFRYAHNLVFNGELTWNPGELHRVEGYTNFLWTIAIAIFLALGFEPVTTSMFLGIICAFGTLFFTYHLSLLVFQNKLWSYLTLIFLGTNYTFSSYMTGGLETQLQTFLNTFTVYYLFYLIENKPLFNKLYLIFFSLLFAINMMTRLDSTIIIVVVFCFFNFSLFRQNYLIKEKIVSLVYLTIPSSIVIGSWLFWKVGYYGDILPNTYYAKATFSSALIFERGLEYIYVFFQSYWLIPFIFLSIFYTNKLLVQAQINVFFTLISVWFLYIIRVGGDFMEFRFIVPVLPFLFLLFCYLISLLKNRRVQGALISIIIIGTLHHFYVFNVHKDYKGIESISKLHGHIINENENWDRVGSILKEMFLETEDPVIIATTASGAIAYYSQLPNIDMLGLNDRWIARNGIYTGVRPGHQKCASIEYLLKRNVNLVIGHPQVEPIENTAVSENFQNDIQKFMCYDGFDTSLIPTNSKIIEIPLNLQYKIKVLYLKQNKSIDRIVKKSNLKTYSKDSLHSE